MERNPGRMVVLTLLSLSSVCWLAACYHFAVAVENPSPATEYEGRTVHALLWGAFQTRTSATNCESNALDEVRVNSNFGYLAVSVLSLGIYVPLEVEWRCAKEPPREGVL